MHVFITGASTGIGRVAALRLDREGFGVFATVRRAEDAEALAADGSERLRVLRLDVTKAAEIAAAAEVVQEAVGPAGLGGLVNNAGVAEPGPVEFIDLDALRHQFEVNVVGQVAVTQALLPLLRAARGRIVNIGSIGGRSVLPFAGAYSASKFALEALTDALRMELHGTGIAVTVIEPAAIATPIWAKALDRPMPPEVEAHYGPMLAAAQAAVREAAARGEPPERVADAIVHALTARRPKTRYLVGRMAYVRLALQQLPDRLRDRALLRVLGAR